MITRFFQPPERDRWDDYFKSGEVLLWQGAHKFPRYALTNKRAYLATSFSKHSLATYAIAADDVVTLTQGRTDNVHFKTIHDRDSDGDRTTQKIGFDNIKEGQEVYALIRQIQRGLT